MKLDKGSHVKVIDYLERMNSSINGNPRYRVGFNDGTSAATAPDSALSYEINNPEWHGVPVTVHVDGRGNITHAEVNYGIGDRVQLHPATDAWMSGDRYGEIVKMDGSTVHVRMDRSSRVRRFARDNVTHVKTRESEDN